MMRYIFPPPSDILSCSVLFLHSSCMSFIFQDGIPPSLAIAGAPYFNNKEGTHKDAILPKSPVGRYIQPISGKNIDCLKQHYNRANPADRTRSQMARTALEESRKTVAKKMRNHQLMIQEVMITTLLMLKR